LSRCSYGSDDTYHCACDVGVVADSDASLCENALESIRKPACESEAGACYG
jgi:hypothetical protein